MPSQQQPFRYISLLLTIITFVVAVTWLRHAQEIVVPLLASAFIAILASSPVGWLKGKNMPTSIAVLLVLIAVIVLLVVVSILLGSSIEQFTSQLPAYKESLKQLLQNVLQWLSNYGINLSKSGLMGALDAGEVMQYAQGFISSVGSLFSKTLLILLTVLFMLLDAWHIPQKVKQMYGRRSAPILKALGDAVHVTREYMAIVALMSLLMGVLITICLWFVGLKYAVLWGVLVFLLNFIPNIGLIIAAIPAVLFSLIQLGPAKTVVVILIYIIVNMFVDMFVQPKLVGSKVGLSVLLVFLSVFFWGWVLGPIGMILSVPLTMIFKYSIAAYREVN